MEGSETLAEVLGPPHRLSAPVTFLDLRGFKWSDETMYLLAEHFYQIEVLRLDLAVDGFPKVRLSESVLPHALTRFLRATSRNT